MKVSSQFADKKNVRHLFFLLLAFGSLSLVASTAFGSTQGNIIQVSRKLRMSYREPLPPKEYYFDLGMRDGLKEGDIIEVFRMIPVINSMSGGAWHLMRVTLGQLRITFLGESTSIGRSVNDREPQSLPSVEYPVFMIGDQVETKIPDTKTGLPFQ